MIGECLPYRFANELIKWLRQAGFVSSRQRCVQFEQESRILGQMSFKPNFSESETEQHSKMGAVLSGRLQTPLKSWSGLQIVGEWTPSCQYTSTIHVCFQSMITDAQIRCHWQCVACGQFQKTLRNELTSLMQCFTEYPGTFAIYAAKHCNRVTQFC